MTIFILLYTEIINLYDLQNKGTVASNRVVTFENSGDKKYPSLSRDRGDCPIWLPVEEFQNVQLKL